MTDISGWSPQQHVDAACELLTMSEDPTVGMRAERWLLQAQLHVRLAHIKLDFVKAGVL